MENAPKVDFVLMQQIITHNVAYAHFLHNPIELVTKNVLYHSRVPTSFAIFWMPSHVWCGEQNQEEIPLSHPKDTMLRTQMNSICRAYL